MGVVIPATGPVDLHGKDPAAAGPAVLGGILFGANAGIHNPHNEMETSKGVRSPPKSVTSPERHAKRFSDLLDTDTESETDTESAAAGFSFFEDNFA